MNFEDQIKLLATERFRRISQGTQIFTTSPPDDFLGDVVQCMSQWTAEREQRHAPKGLIYHYCDATALLSILNSRKVWATSTKYLNDTTELLALTGNFKDHADRHRGTEAGDALSDIIDFYSISSARTQTQTIGMDRFACCFSANGDLLSQWRAYGNNGRGYAIGFNPELFQDLAKTPGLSLRRITYGGEKEALLIDDLINRFKSIIEPHLNILDNTGTDRQSARNWLSMRFGECLFELVEEIKHPAFIEEDEWRLYPTSHDAVRYRVSQDRVVPYVEIDLSSSKNPNLMPIVEIVVGPRLDYREALASLMTYTSSLGYGISMPFRQSAVPYR